MNRIDALFERLHQESRTALMPFLTAGDPDLQTTSALIPAFVSSGADLIELGIPYSDPIADGPVIAESYARALARGVRLDTILHLVEKLRPELKIPLVAMVSYSIVHRRGATQFIESASTAGLDGMIVPDLPVEEAEALLGLCRDAGLCLIQLVTPRTPRERALQIARTSSGFLYYVSVAGITGERRELPPDLAENLAWLRSQTKLPICVGFGISRPDQVRSLTSVADGVIVGSAIVRRIADLAASGAMPQRLVEDLAAFVAELAGSK